MVICLNLSPQTHLYQFCYYWKTKLKVVFEEEIKLNKKKNNKAMRCKRSRQLFSKNLDIQQPFQPGFCLFKGRSRHDTNSYRAEFSAIKALGCSQLAHWSKSNLSGFPRRHMVYQHSWPHLKNFLSCQLIPKIALQWNKLSCTRGEKQGRPRQ